MASSSENPVRYDYLVDALPKGEFPPFSMPTTGVEFVASSHQAFVPPSLVVTEGVIERARAVVLSAPAAAGKSTLARQLAFDTNALLLDLAEWNVGNNFLPGTIFAAFGDQVGSILSDISASKSTLIVDAVDETQLRSGENNFEQFLGDVATFLSTSGDSGPSIVILGRAETAEFVSLFLEEKGVPFARVSIEYFDHPRAMDFLDVQLDSLSGETGSHRTHRRRYEQIRDDLWTILHDAVGAPRDSREAASFLGYPPVLTAVASFVSEPNLQRLETEVARIGGNTTGSGSQPWSFISAIANAVLVREQGKIGRAVRERLESTNPANTINWDSLYAPEEQCARVADWIHGNESSSNAPLTAMPDAVRVQYLQLIETAVSQHPFLGAGRNFANVVFRDFVDASELRNPDEVRRRRARSSLSTPGRLPTPLLGYFLISSSSAQPLEGADIGTIYDSLSAREAEPGTTRVTVRDRADANNRVDVAIGTPEAAAQFLADCTFEPVAFRRRIRSAEIDTAGMIVFGSEGGDFQLGPDVDIRAGLLAIEASAVRVVTNEDGWVDLLADSYQGPTGALDLRVIGSGQLRSSWPDLVYPWTAFESEFDSPDASDDDEAHVKLRHLSHIFKYFVRHRRSSLQAAKQLIDNIAVGASPDAQAVFRALLANGVVAEHGGTYYVDADAFTSRGINYPDLRHRIMTDNLRRFVDSISLS